MGGRLEWHFIQLSFCRSLNRSKKSYLCLFTSVEDTECSGQLASEASLKFVDLSLLTV